MKLCSQEQYEGIFLNGLFHDFGYLQGFGLIYKGYFRKGLFHGFGKINYPNNSSFEGIFHKGQFVKGALNWPDGKYYQGEFNSTDFRLNTTKHSLQA